MKTYNKKTLLLALECNTQQQKKAKYSNEIIMNMLNNLNDDFTATLEPTRAGFLVNRGSLVECIIKYVINGQSTKSAESVADLDTTKTSAQVLDFYGLPKSKNIEIKFSTSFAPATHKSNKARYTIIAGADTIVLIESKNIKTTGAGKININNQSAKDCKQLTNLMQRLGY